MSVSDDYRKKLAGSSSATLSGLLLKKGLRNTVIRGVRPARVGLPPMIGPAFTVRYIPSREDIDGTEYSSNPENSQRKAIDTIPEGSVLVFDCRQIVDVAGIGGILTRRLRYRKAAGLVLDGGIRDYHDVAEMAFPAYCTGPAAPANFVCHHAADMEVPIACGGVPVFPGDIIFGDSEAVVVIPPQYVDEIADEALQIEEQEVYIKQEIDTGNSIFGVYPPNDDTMRRFNDWRARQSR